MLSNDNVVLFLGTTPNDMQPIFNIKDYAVHWDLFMGTGSMVFEIDVNAYVWLSTGPVQFRIEVNSVAVMTGFVDKVSRTYTKGTNSLTITGRDMMQVLTDNYVLAPQVYESLPIQSVINDVWATSNTVSKITVISPTSETLDKIVTLNPALKLPSIDFTYSGPALSAVNASSQIKKMRTSHGMSLFTFISSLVNPIGVVMYMIPGTSTVRFVKLQQPGESAKSYDRSGSPVQEDPWPIQCLNGSDQTESSRGNNVIACNFTQDVQNYHKYVKVLGQSEEEEQFDNSSQAYNVKKNRLKIERVEGDDNNTGDTTLGFRGVTKFYSASVNTVDSTVWFKARRELVNNEIIQQNRHLFSIKYTVQGHTTDNGSLYFINHLCRVIDVVTGSFEADFLTYSVTYRGSKDKGQTTELDLCLPGGFSGSSNTVEFRKFLSSVGGTPAQLAAKQAAVKAAFGVKP